MDIAGNLKAIKSSLPERVKLVAITKTQTVPAIMKAYESGHRIFGENKVQELINKYQQLPNDIEWHMVGHLQTNKVKHIVPFIHLIHGVDSMKLLEMIDREGSKINRVIRCLLQIRIAQEETKFGLPESEAGILLESAELSHLKYVKICGLMGMATFTDNTELIRSEFKNLSNIFNRLRQQYFTSDPEFTELSMGMSNDFRIAIEEGATYIRIGSLIFGERVTT